MPAYRYRAVHASGHIAEGNLSAANEGELNEYLNTSGLELIEAKIKKDQPINPHIFKRTAPRTLSVFAAQMQDLLKAEVPFIDALQDIAKTQEPGPMKDALTCVARDINHGSRIAKAFARHERHVPPVFTAILAAGEASGNLIRTFENLTCYAESRAKTAEQLRRALRYPLFLCCVTFGTVTFMMTMVVPQIVQFLHTIDNELPLITRLMIAASEFFAATWWMILLTFITAAALTAILRKTSDQAALTIDSSILRLPLIGTILEKLALARFSHSFAILFQSGIGVLGSLQCAKATLTNRALETKLEESARQVQSGRPLSAALSEILPPFALRMIRTGEKCGRLEKCLTDIATAYDREVTDVTEKSIGSLEPALTIMIGGILAWIVLAVLGPIYGSLGKLTGGG